MQETKIRTAAYCRVSTAAEEQEGSYKAQKDYFTQRILSDPNMVLVGIYCDRRSGLKIESRQGLKQLLTDCEAGKIDYILTKSISRLARSMADCAMIIRRLRELDITIHFEKEKLLSSDVKCDLILNILASIAQEESHSISQNVIRAHAQYARAGRPFGAVSFGYRCCKNNQWIIHESEARQVRTAFSMAAIGHTYEEILIVLNREETVLPWKQKRLKYLLRNVSYKGDYFSHKTICPVPGRQVVNRGYRDRYYIVGHHAPIVTSAEFAWVQAVMDRGLLSSNHKRTREDLYFLQSGGSTL